MSTKNPDIVIRLPEEKKYLKAEMYKIARKNGMTMTALFTFMMEWFVTNKEIDVKIRIGG